MKIQLSADSWHVRLQSFIFETDKYSILECKNLCPYFWMTIFSIISIVPKFVFTKIANFSTTLTRNRNDKLAESSDSFDDETFFRYYIEYKRIYSDRSRIIVERKKALFKDAYLWFDFIDQLERDYGSIIRKEDAARLQKRYMISQYTELVTKITMVAGVVLGIILLITSILNRPITILFLLAGVVLAALWIGLIKGAEYLYRKHRLFIFSKSEAATVLLSSKMNLFSAYLSAIKDRACPRIEWKSQDISTKEESSEQD